MPAYAELNAEGYFLSPPSNNGTAPTNGVNPCPEITSDARPVYTFGVEPITIEDVIRISKSKVQVKMNLDPTYVARINQGPLTLEKLLNNDHIVYGVNTGYGNSCTTKVPMELVTELPAHLVKYHCAGLGRHFGLEETRALLTARIVSLTKGFSAVRMDLLNQLVMLLQHDILPLVPEEGSVGASGDLTPLSYVAAVLCGDRQVMYKGEIQDTRHVFEKLAIKPLSLFPKEGLAMMNGTSVMTGLACLAFHRAQTLSRLATRMTSLAVVSLKGNAFHYDATLFSVKEHGGQQLVARQIRQDLQVPDAPQEYSKVVRIQDRYSLRCAPHVIGVLEDALPFFRTIIQTELNSANDNPIIDVETERVFHGGMFYGGHIAFVMDSLKTTVANLADLMDRQMALLVDPNYNNGLPANLSGACGYRAPLNHGLKALQISMSAWTAEALKQTLPASIFSRSTESHNQDKVSMGTIAARDCLRVIELTEQVAVGLLIAVKQAIILRKGLIRTDDQESEVITMSSDVNEFLDDLNPVIPFLGDDCPLEPILRRLLDKLRTNELGKIHMRK